MSATLAITKPSNHELDVDDWYEVINGERKEIDPMGAYENLLASFLSNLMGTYATNKRLGLVGVEILFELCSDPILQRRPDIAFVSKQRCRERPIGRESAWPVVPDLAIEFVSATNLADEIDAKLVDYFENGVRQVWVIYPESRRVCVHESLKTTRSYSEDEPVDASPVIPGFTFRLADLFTAIEDIIDEA